MFRYNKTQFSPDNSSTMTSGAASFQTGFFLNASRTADSAKTLKKERDQNLGDTDEIVLTPAGFAELNQEYERLRTVERREVADRIRDAITYGELTENSEYEDAKNQQAFLEGRIEDMRHILQAARVLEDEEIPTDKVGVGSIVTVEEETGDDWEFRIVTPTEADPSRDKISDEVASRREPVWQDGRRCRARARAGRLADL